MYISDPKLWKTFYSNMMKDKINHGKQRGGGITNMYSKKSFIIPVNRFAKEDEKIVVGKQVTPVEAVQERAQVNLSQAIQEEKPHIPTDIRTRNQIHDISMKATRKRRGSNFKHKKTRKQKGRAIKKSKLIKRKKKTKTSKKKNYNNIFSKKR